MCERWWMMAAFGAALALSTACDDTLFGVQQEVDGGGLCQDTPEGYPGVQEIIADQCLGCHNTAAALGGLDLEADLIAATVGVVGSSGAFLVAEGSPDDSLLYQRMTGGAGSPMPPTGLLDVSCTDIVKAWIEGGALAQ